MVNLRLQRGTTSGRQVAANISHVTHSLHMSHGAFVSTETFESPCILRRLFVKNLFVALYNKVGQKSPKNYTIKFKIITYQKKCETNFTLCTHT
jgi:hypothetical protein